MSFRSKVTNKVFKSFFTTVSLGLVCVTTHADQAVFVLPVKARAFEAIEAGLQKSLGNKADLRILLASDYRGKPGGITEAALSFKPEIILPLGTTLSRAFLAAAETRELPPILCVAVTNPEDVLPKLELAVPRKVRATVITDGPPSIYACTADLIAQLVPNCKTIGTVYNPGELNSQSNLERIRTECQRRGWKLVEKGIHGPEDVEAAGRALLADRSDAIFISKDRVMTSQPQPLIELAHANRIPVFASDAGTVEDFHAVGTCSVSFDQLGEYIGRVALRILAGEDVRQIPVSTLEHTRVFLSSEALQKLGLDVPRKVAESAIVFGGSQPSVDAERRFSSRRSLRLHLAIIIVGAVGAAVMIGLALRQRRKR